MREETFLVKADDTSVFHRYTEADLRLMLRSFEKDYIRDRIEDLYRLSKTASMDQILSELEEIKEWNLDYYSNINDMSTEEVIRHLKAGYNFTILKTIEV